MPEGASADQVARLVFDLWVEIVQALHPVFGHRGVAALYQRSLVLSAAAHPWLAAVAAPGQPATLDPAALRDELAQLSPAEATAGASALFGAFHGLLASLVGSALTDRLLLPVWAQPPAASPAQDPLP
jgi:hypothetical protein